MSGKADKDMTPTSSVQASPSPSTQPSTHHAQGTDVPYDTLLDQPAPAEDDPPPPYGELFGHIENEQDDLNTRAHVTDDGRVNIHINQKSTRLSNLFRPALQRQPELRPDQIPYIPPTLGRRTDRAKPPFLNVVIHVVGSRGDVQPFVALGKVLREQYRHRVRLATHETFRDFVTENGLEFFSIGGNPSELMAFMVKNPGLMPGFDTLRTGDVGHRRREIAKMVKGCWRSCIETGDGTGPVASDETIEDWAGVDTGTGVNTHTKPFVADVIIANPPSFAHVHCAEKLGIPLHMMFTMPWSPTQAFPHPLANVQTSNADASMTNFMTYALVDMMTWQGLGDVINRFRQKSLGLDPISLTWAPGMLARLKVPWTYCWSPALIPKPRDWSANISISGFYFLNLATNYTPDPDLNAFLDAGPPPVYIGFGSIVLEDPDGMTKLIFDAVRQTGQRALVSKGWGGFGADQIGIPDNVFMLGNVPHDWLFKRVSCVVHHGGAGTTAAGIAAGKPTVIVPFFGDQPFWGAMVAKAGAGPAPIPSKNLNAESLAQAITEAIQPPCVQKAKELSARISEESGSESGAESFHYELEVDRLRCQLSPRRAAVWRIRRTNFRLSTFAATVLAHEKLLDFRELKLYRPQEYDPDDGPWDPITGGASALIGTMGSMAMGIADMPVATLKAMKIHPEHRRRESGSHPQSRSGTPAQSGQASENLSAADLKSARKESMQSIESIETKSSTSSRSSIAGEEAAAAQEIGGAMMGEAAGRAEDTSAPQPPESTDGTGEKKGFKFNQEDMETLLLTGKGAWRFTEAGFKSPLDFTLALAKGFHNAPKLYGDETVRKPDKITDLSSGVRAAGKEFGLGLYDGIAGLVTQPIKGAKKEGAAGFVKGVGKGIGGIALKPGAAVFALPSFTAQGMYRELRNKFGPSVQGYIVAARTAQGYDEMQKASAEEYRQIIKDWEDVRYVIKKKKHVGEEKMEEIKGRMREVGSRSRSGSAASKWQKASPVNQLAHSRKEGHPIPMSGADGSIGEDAEFEAAIKRSVAQTSKGNAEEDQAIERAIRASVTELEEAEARGAGEEELKRAVAASLAEAQKGNLSRGDSHMKAESSRGGRKNGATAHGAVEPDEDEEMERAIRESKSMAPEAQEQEDEQLRLVMDESKEAHDKHAAEQQKAADEEEIVMKYVLRQSEAEEKLRRQKTGQSSTAPLS